ncbi:sporulation protein [Thermoanaerobacterium sp. RBIITD]|uniref:sporulation protein n=1 Tax=Thermoanaerobacterium sp. RBIITD TaxID=1550240 RepID=UPI000BB9244A|nr:sporulation protein [Thermoanaerobacterium sp. RBIITD]
MRTRAEEKKNERYNRKIILAVFIIPIVSILVGFLITQFLIKPYIVKISNNTLYEKYTFDLPTLNYYQVKFGEYKDENEAKYNLNLLMMKGLFGDIYLNGDKYILSVGNFLNEQNAIDYNKRLNISGVKATIILNKGPLYEIAYEKNSSHDVEITKEYVNSLYENLSQLSILSYKTAMGNVDVKDIDILESTIKNSIKNIKYFNDKGNLQKIASGITSINNFILSDIKDLKTSVQLQDGNAFSITQKALINSIKSYDGLISSLK